MVGATDALKKTRRTFPGAPTLMTQIDIAPVDAEVERRGTYHRAQLARCHGILDLAPLRHVERAMMQRDGQQGPR